MRNVFGYAWRTLRSDARRHRSSSITLMIGTAMIVAAVLAGQAAVGSVRTGIESLGGVGDVAVVPDLGAAPLGAAAVSAVESLPDVALAVPTSSHDTFVVAQGHPDVDGADLTVTGVPSEATLRLGSVLRSGRWPSADDELTVPDRVASDLDVRTGDVLRVGASDGTRAMRVVGMLDANALGLFAEGNVFATLGGAWRLSGTSDAYTRVELVLETRDRSTWADRVRPSLPPGTRVQDTSALTDALGPIARTTTALVAATGGVALVIGVVLAASTGAELRRRRRASTAVLVAVGAPPSWPARALVAEALIAGLLTTTTGAALGVGAAWLVSGVTSNALPSPGPAGLTGACAIVVGTFANVVAVWSSQRTHGGRAPRAQSDRRPSRRRGWAPSPTSCSVAVCVGISTIALTEGGLLSSVVSVSASVIGAAAAAVLVRRASGRGLRRLHWTANGLTSSGGSSLAAVVAVLLVFSTALLSAAIGISTATQQQIAHQFGADVQVTSTSPLPNAVRSAIAGVDGVGAMADSSVATVRARVGGSTAEVPALGVAAGWFTVEDLAWRSGDADSARRAISSGNGVALPQSLAERLGAHIGDEVDLGFEGRETEGEVVGTFTSLATGDQIVLGPDSMSALAFPAPTGLDIATTSGSDAVLVRDRVAAVVRDVPGAIAITATEMRSRAGQQLATTFAGVFALIGLAGTMGAVGTAGSYRALVDRRRSELAVLRAVGATRRHLVAVVRWEWAAAVIAAIVPAALFGIVTARAVSNALGTLLGVDVPTTAGSGPFALAAAVVAATMGIATFGPGRRAARVDPAEALKEND